MKTLIRACYGPKPISQILFHDEEGNHDGRTEQHHKKACDIHNIIHQYDKTGLVSHVTASVARYGDYTEVNEYQESLNMVIRAQDAFSALPAHVRKRFDNDPGQFFEFATNPDNLEAMVELGLAEKIRQPAPTKVEVVNPPEAPADEA